MPGRRPPKKSELPSKVCIVCGRLFAWRKKWERDWPQVKYCSDRCRMRRGRDRSAEETGAE
jgi:hypothetical protein